MLSFQDCQTLTIRKPKRKISDNTTLRKIDANTFAVRFHNTDVVLIHADGTFTLSDGGYQTRTTKARINEFSPACIRQRKFQWHLRDGSEFVSPARIDSTGTTVKT